MNFLENSQTLNEFNRNAIFFADELKKSRQPLVLTVDGRAELVVLDTETYQEFLDKIEFAETVKDLKEGVESFERGEGRPARQALEELTEKYGIPR